MGTFHNFSGLAAPLDLPNVDTDQMVPGRFLMKPRDYDYGSLLFHDLRVGARRDPNFVLNQSRYEKSEILIGGENFGCGSAREQAAYALIQFGIRAVFAPSFGDIFRRNCLNNGLLIGIVESSDAVALCETIRSHQGAHLAVDLAAQTITTDGGAVMRFRIDNGDKQKLLSGLDDVDLTLARQSEIDAFERKYMAGPNWLRMPLGQAALRNVEDNPAMGDGVPNA
jgi:3-isopropylmalate/(R)-2-methylmalate dehydratase small subunit